MTLSYILKRSAKKHKKFALQILDSNGNTRTINFGALGYSDYTQHKNPDRKKFYIERHEPNEKQFWSHTSQITPSYLSRYLLWQEPNLNDAIKYVEKARGITIHKQL